MYRRDSNLRMHWTLATVDVTDADVQTEQFSPVNITESRLDVE